MILSVSRRTDIPCHYAEWFFNRIEAGEALYRNPMNRKQLFSIPLSPQGIDCIVFWTKDPKNLMKLNGLSRLDQLGYRYYFQFTLTPYDRRIERNLRKKADIEETFIELGRALGRERVLWRYDPILLDQDLDLAYHKREFERLCHRLGPYTDRVTISFVDIYAKLKAVGLRPVAEEEMAELAAFIGERARAHGLAAKVCCEEERLAVYGMEKAACIDPLLIEGLCGGRLKPVKDKHQRPGCGCLASVDLGAYDTCINGCIYCYATYGKAAAARNYTSHDPAGELLSGQVAGDEIIRERQARSLLL